MRAERPELVSQLVKDLDLKAFHNRLLDFRTRLEVSQLVKDLDLKAFHNAYQKKREMKAGITARQRS